MTLHRRGRRGGVRRARRPRRLRHGRARPSRSSSTIDVRALNDDIEVISEPADRAGRARPHRPARRCRSTVDIGNVPEGLEAGTPETSEDEVLVRGPASIVDAASTARLRSSTSTRRGSASIGRSSSCSSTSRASPSAKGWSTRARSPSSVRVDARGGGGDPPRAGATADRPAPRRPGFALEALRVEPSTVILRGRPEALADITVIVTEPLSIEGVSSDQSFEAVLVLPDGVSLRGR